MKQIVVFVCLVLVLGGNPAIAGLLRNPGFSSDLGSWMIYHEGTNGSTPGTVTWEGAGSVLMEASGSPGTIGLAQPTCAALSVGDSAWVDVQVVSGSGTFSLSLGDNNGSGANGQQAEIVDTLPGSYRLRIVANRVYPQGTWYSFRILAWPGPMQVRISAAGAILEQKAGKVLSIPDDMRATPNPATGQSTVRFSTARAGRVRLAVYDALGTLVRELVERQYWAGPHSVTWDGRDEGHQIVSPGTYIIKLSTGDGRELTTAVVVNH